MPRRLDQNTGSDRTRRGTSADSSRSRRRTSEGEAEAKSNKSSHKKAADSYIAKSFCKGRAPQAGA